MKTKTDLSKYIVNVQGKDFITFPGLLAEAHALGLHSINTELLTSPADLSNPVVKATVTLKVDKKGDNTLGDGFSLFTAYGDASEKNVAPKVRGALLRMAETRSIARALRFACNIDMAAIEELDAEDNVINSKPVTKPTTLTSVVTSTKASEPLVVNAPVKPSTFVKKSFSKPD